jgi:transposase-like protein
VSQRVRRTQKDYTLGFKQPVVDQVEGGEISYKEAQRRYGIQGRSTVLVWLRRHGRQDWHAGIPAPFSACSCSPTTARPPTPEQRIKELEALLQQAHLREQEAEQKAQFFKAVVDVLEKDHGVYLVKKWSGKSSRKHASPG